MSPHKTEGNHDDPAVTQALLAKVADLEHVALTQLRRGLIQAARGALRGCLELLEPAHHPQALGATWRHAAALEVLARELDTAHDMLLEAITLHTHCDAAPQQLRTLLLASGLAHALGDPTQAQHHLQTAHLLAHTHPQQTHSTDLYRCSMHWLSEQLASTPSPDTTRALKAQLAASDDQMAGQWLSTTIAPLTQSELALDMFRRGSQDLSASTMLQHLEGSWIAVETSLAVELLRMAAQRDATLKLMGGSIPLVVSADRGAWFELGAGERVDLSRRGALRNVLGALLEQSLTSPHAGLSVTQLFGAGWPGERAGLQSMRARVYVAIRELRELGLHEVLQHVSRGYRLDPRVNLKFTR